MVHCNDRAATRFVLLSVLALSSRFDGRFDLVLHAAFSWFFQYSLCRVVLMVTWWDETMWPAIQTFSTRSVESF